MEWREEPFSSSRGFDYCPPMLPSRDHGRCEWPWPGRCWRSPRRRTAHALRLHWY